VRHTSSCSSSSARHGQSRRALSDRLSARLARSHTRPRRLRAHRPALLLHALQGPSLRSAPSCSAHAQPQPWPIIAAFLAAQPRAALGLDAGTGNGKYLPLAPQLLGLDRSGALLGIARRGGAHEVVRGDVLDAPWRAGVFVRPRCRLCRARS
jgi:hypothetical protein